MKNGYIYSAEGCVLYDREIRFYFQHFTRLSVLTYGGKKTIGARSLVPHLATALISVPPTIVGKLNRNTIFAANIRVSTRSFFTCECKFCPDQSRQYFYLNQL